MSDANFFHEKESINLDCCLIEDAFFFLNLQFCLAAIFGPGDCMCDKRNGRDAVDFVCFVLRFYGPVNQKMLPKIACLVGHS